MANWASPRGLCAAGASPAVLYVITDRDSGVRGWEVLLDGRGRTVDGESWSGTILPPR